MCECVSLQVSDNTTQPIPHTPAADASDCYEKAWRADGESSAPVGYKLAFNYLKAGRATAAIDIAQKVLAAFPTYPRIRDEVLNRARALVRTEVMV